MPTSQNDRAQAFRALHEGHQTFVIPNPWDAGSAKMLAALGFPALATTSAGFAFSIGRPDGANAISRDETLQNARAIVEATPLPVSADLENGFGDEPEACAETILRAAEAGLVGGSIEDATGRPGEPIGPPAGTLLPNVALVHDWLTGMRGGERVLEAIAGLFPGAPIYTLFHFRGSVSPALEAHPILASFLQRWPSFAVAARSRLLIRPDISLKATRQESSTCSR